MKNQGVVSALLFFVCSGFLLIAGCSRWHDDQYGAFLDKKYEKAVSYFTKKLDLDANQKVLLRNAANQLKDLEQSFYGPPTIRDEMYDQLAGASIDQTKMNSIIKEKVSTFDQKSSLIVERVTAFQQSLSPEQREKFVYILKKFDRKTRHYRWRLGL